MSPSLLKKQQQKSPLLQQKRLRSAGAQGKSKSLIFNLNLTTLIDAFCILVIFLLSNMNGQLQNIQIGKNLVLPTAVGTEVLETGLVVRLEGNRFFVEEKEATLENLTQLLLDRKSSEKNSLIIQADRNSNYDQISLLLRAGAQAGYEKYVFAVLPGRTVGL